ncbi:MAG: MFS transporter [Deltaproteobacteria bacterium]|nr:MFS transporter [Deltaproteobacteria bacterium]
MDLFKKDKRKIILGSQYFLYFGVMGIFLPYFNLYCFHLGFNGFQIGVLSTLRSVTLVVFPLLWGVLSDRFRIRKPLYIFFNIVSSLTWAFYLFTTNFWFIFALTFFYGIFYAPIISFLEAFTMEILGIQKNQYGSIRAWGSISFIVTVILLGKLIDLYAIEIILIFILIMSLFQAVISPKIPNSPPVKRTYRSTNIKALLTGRVIIFLTCGFLMLLSHGTYYGFFSIHLENLGYSNTFIGLTWAVASIAEIFAMLKSDWIFKRFRIEKVLIFSFIIAAARWFFLYFTIAPFAILLTQLLHAITYGTFHMASILYIDQLTPDNAVSYGLGLMIGFFINGYLYERLGSAHLFIFSSAIAITGGMLFLAFRVVTYKSQRN